MTGFQDLEVWKRSHELTLEIYRHAKSFPTDERYRFTDQLCRAASSVPTNIAEGTGRQGNREFRHFLYVARGSVEEVKYLLLLGRDLGYLNSDDYDHLRQGYDTVGKMLNGLINSLNKLRETYD